VAASSTLLQLQPKNAIRQKHAFVIEAGFLELNCCIISKEVTEVLSPIMNDMSANERAFSLLRVKIVQVTD